VQTPNKYAPKNEDPSNEELNHVAPVREPGRGWSGPALDARSPLVRFVSKRPRLDRRAFVAIMRGAATPRRSRLERRFARRVFPDGTPLLNARFFAEARKLVS